MDKAEELEASAAIAEDALLCARVMLAEKVPDQPGIVVPVHEQARDLVPARA